MLNLIKKFARFNGRAIKATLLVAYGQAVVIATIVAVALLLAYVDQEIRDARYERWSSDQRAAITYKLEIVEDALRAGYGEPAEYNTRRELVDLAVVALRDDGCMGDFGLISAADFFKSAADKAEATGWRDASQYEQAARLLVEKATVYAGRQVLPGTATFRLLADAPPVKTAVND